MDNNLTGLLSLLDALQSSGKIPGNSLSPIMDWLKKMMGNSGNINALGGGNTGNVFANMVNGQAGPPLSPQSVFRNMLGFGDSGTPGNTTPAAPSMGQGQQSGFPMNALASGMFGDLAYAPRGGGFQTNQRLQYLGGGAGGIYPSQTGWQM